MSRSWIATLCAVAVLVACPAPPDSIRTDVQAYLARSRSWASIEAETARAIKRILDTQFVDEAEIHRLIADSRPRVQEHLARVRQYQPHSESVARIHERYVHAWEALGQAYDRIEEGFSTGDYTQLARGREGLTAWRDAIVTVATELRELARNYDLDTGVLQSDATPACTGLPV